MKGGCERSAGLVGTNLASVATVGTHADLQYLTLN